MFKALQYFLQNLDRICAKQPFPKADFASHSNGRGSATVQSIFSHTADFLVASVGEEEHTRQTIRGTADRWL